MVAAWRSARVYRRAQPTIGKLVDDAMAMNIKELGSWKE